jgi:glycosyltransferase involved in cell wall biosynthesis
MKTALVYDRVNKWGGAERVLLALHKLFPDAPLYTSVYNEGQAKWANVFNIKSSFLQNFPNIISNHESYPFLMPIAFEQFNFDDYDLVISMTSEAAKGIITRPGTKHLCYCLTPTRYLWSGYDDYFKNPIFKFFSHPAVSYLRTWDKISSNRPDFYIAASSEVKKRIKKYYGLESEVIYPPLSINDEKSINDKKRAKGDYFLVVSRMVPYKRIDLAIEACNELRLPLKIIGSGKEENSLRKIAGPTIEFLGNITDEQLIEYYIHAKALIHPGIEDFGLTILEAQKFKKPVIALKAGGALETINEGKTGLFFDSQDKESLLQKIKELDNYSFKDEEFSKQVEKFSFSKFKSNFLSLVEKVI